MPFSLWHNYVVLVSFVSCIAGLSLLVSTQQNPADEQEATSQILLKMIFAYWMVYCVAFGVQQLNLPNTSMFLPGIKLIAVVTYLLTFTCVLTLPLHFISSSKQIE